MSVRKENQKYSNMTILIKNISLNDIYAWEYFHLKTH